MEDKKTPWTYKVVYFLVKLFSPKYKIVGAEKLPAEPCVIAGNHSQMYGPIAGEIYTPGRHYVWCAGEMMNADEVIFTSASALCCRVTKIDGKPVGGKDFALFDRIRQAAKREIIEEADV